MDLSLRGSAGVLLVLVGWLVEAGRILDAGVALVPVAQWVLLELYFVLSSIALAPYMHKGKRNRGSKL